jgi:hypothetical protein
MTASGSSSRRPHDIPLPLSPEKPISKRNSKKRKKGKEKEKEGNAPPARRVGQDEWDHTRAGTEPWQCVPLTDSSASKHPPIFTKDGRCGLLFGRLILICTAEKDNLDWFIAIFLPLSGRLSRYTPVLLVKSYPLLPANQIVLGLQRTQT